MDINVSIQEAIQKAKSGDLQSAQIILASVLRQEPRNARAWYLLSQVIGDRNREIDCLKKVLEIEPNNPQAKARLQKLQQGEAPIQRQYATPLIRPTPKKNKASNLLIFFLVLGLSGLGVCLIVYFDIKNVPDATQCVQVGRCIGNDRGASSVLSGGITNTCSKPITNISLHGTVSSGVGYQTNVTLDQIDGGLQTVLAPGGMTYYILTIPNKNYGAFDYYNSFDCQVSAKGAYFIQNAPDATQCVQVSGCSIKDGGELSVLAGASPVLSGESRIHARSRLQISVCMVLL